MLGILSGVLLVFPCSPRLTPALRQTLRVGEQSSQDLVGAFTGEVQVLQGEGVQTEFGSREGSPKVWWNPVEQVQGARVSPIF